MKILIKILCLTLIFNSCISDTDREYSIMELQGDWIGEGEQEMMVIHGDKILINQPWLVRYLEFFIIKDNEILIDSMRFRRHEEVKKYKFGRKYKIDYLEKDTLRLIEYSIKDTIQKEVLHLKRLSLLNQYDFEKLSISSSPCYGSCPIFQLEINSNGGVKFEGINFTDKEGNYVGKIKATTLKLIQKQVDKINWKKLKSEYWSNITDIQYFNIEMIDKKGEKYFLTTNSPDTKAVNILIFRAFKIIENSTLEKAKEDLEFSTELIPQ